MMRYPREVFCANELVTRENMRKYDERQRKIDLKIKEIAPNYDSMTLLERYEVRKQAESLIK